MLFTGLLKADYLPMQMLSYRCMWWGSGHLRYYVVGINNVGRKPATEAG